jgi:carboxylesterase type B
MPTLTNTVSAQVADRIAIAYGKHLGLARPATVEEVNTERARELKQFVLHIERQTSALQDLEIT